MEVVAIIRSLSKDAQERVDRLQKCGYIYKRLSTHWFLVRKYATKRKLFYHFIKLKYIK
jgi:hypothetical protein